MQKGKQTLYNTLVASSVDTHADPLKRNCSIDDRRDAMAHRYYFHAIINRLRYDDCLMSLQQEFFLQPDTIVKELHKRFDLINDLIDQKTTTSELRKKYPWYNWVGRLV